MSTEDKTYKTFNEHQPDSDGEKTPFETSPNHIVISENTEEDEPVSGHFGFEENICMGFGISQSHSLRDTLPKVALLMVLVIDDQHFIKI